MQYLRQPSPPPGPFIRAVTYSLHLHSLRVYFNLRHSGQAVIRAWNGCLLQCVVADIGDARPWIVCSRWSWSCSQQQYIVQHGPLMRVSKSSLVASSDSDIHLWDIIKKFIHQWLYGPSLVPGHLEEGTEKAHGIRQSWYPMSRPRFEAIISLMWV
jgi:hypothetical protein